MCLRVFLSLCTFLFFMLSFRLKIFLRVRAFFITFNYISISSSSQQWGIGFVPPSISFIGVWMHLLLHCGCMYTNLTFAFQNVCSGVMLSNKLFLQYFRIVLRLFPLKCTNPQHSYRIWLEKLHCCLLFPSHTKTLLVQYDCFNSSCCCNSCNV